MLSLLRRLLPLILIFSSNAPKATAQDQPRTLTVNSRIERELAGGQTHSYALNLRSNQIARVIIEQRGVDVVVGVISPDGKKLFEVDSPTGTQGDETATIFATQPGGAYVIEIRALEQKAPAGKYEIRLDRFLTESEYTTERLAALGRLWGAVKYFHPYLAYKDIDWDGALIKVIPQVKAARTPNEYSQAVGNLLQALDDPATTVELASIETAGSTPMSSEKKEPTYFRVVEGFVVVSALDWANAFVSGNREAFSKQPQMLQEIGKAKGIVLDCRYGSVSASELPPFYLRAYLENTLPLLVQGAVTLGTERYRIHNGYPPQRGGTSGGYTTVFVTEAPGVITGQAQTRKPLALIIDEKTPDLSALSSGLQASGAKIVQVGKNNGPAAGRFHPIALPDGVRVRMRITEFVHPGGGSVFQADTQIPADGATDEKVISAAIAALNNLVDEKPAATTADTVRAPAMRGLKDAPSPQMSFPSEEYRLLALFRFWNVINYFFPYKHLTDRPWNTVLTDFIPRFLENKSALDYEMTVAEMVARIQDSHGFVGGFKSLNMHLGNSAPPITLQSVGGKLVVGAFLDQAAADAAAVKIGDVILAIDGEPTEKRISYLSKFRALSTTQSAYSYIYPLALRGPADTKVRLRIEGADGRVRETELSRTASLEKVAPSFARKTPIYQVLPSGYGYIDLARLPLADAHKALDAVMNTPAIIFDMRGYPNGTAWELAPRLTKKKSVTAALFRRPFQSATNLVDEDLEGAQPDYSFEQKLPPAKGAIYQGKVVMLINHNAISQAEHTCMFFESATNVTFIGTPTNGANGDVTNLVLPGGIYASFSGHDVRHADGRQLQRVGIQPHIKIEPTISGIREGRDEILEGAIKFLDSTANR
jgi:C-terminal processing protease CtpA/Prc